MTPELEAQERASVESRMYLARLMCRCGTCTAMDIELCVLCDRFRPRCLTKPAKDQDGGEWRACVKCPEGETV